MNSKNTTSAWQRYCQQTNDTESRNCSKPYGLAEICVWSCDCHNQCKQKKMCT